VKYDWFREKIKSGKSQVKQIGMASGTESRFMQGLAAFDQICTIEKVTDRMVKNNSMRD